MSTDDITPVREPQLLAKGWEELQVKTFTKWINSKIKSSGLTIESIASSELSDGTILAALLSKISNEIVRVNRNCNLRIQKIENVSKCLNFIASKNVSLQNIGAEDIVDTNHKLILGMIWTVILRFTIVDISDEGKTAREGLLLWCRRRLEEKYDLKIDNFTSSWANGKAYAALLHSRDPTAINYQESLKKSDKARTQEAFDVAEDQFEISKLLDAEDVCVPGGPDEKSNMTYVAQFFHAFSEKSNYERASRRCANFIANLAAVKDMINDYERRATVQIDAYSSQADTWAKVTFDDTYQDVQSKFSSYRSFKRSQKRDLITEKSNLFTLFSNIQTKSKTYGFKPYFPPAHLSLETVDMSHVDFLKNEGVYLKTLSHKSREIKDCLQRDFAGSANSFDAKINAITKKLANLSGELNDQLSSILQLQEEHSQLGSDLPDLEKSWNKCVDAVLDIIDSTHFTYDDLQTDYMVLDSSIKMKVQFVESEIEVSKASNVSSENRNLYGTTFKLFDTNGDNLLNKDELSAALASLNISLSEEEVSSRLKRSNDSLEPSINFVDFVELVTSLVEDKSSCPQVLDSVKVIGGGKPHVTKEDIANIGLDEQAVQSLVSNMKKVSDDPVGYDFAQLVKDTFEE